MQNLRLACLAGLFIVFTTQLKAEEAEGDSSERTSAEERQGKRYEANFELIGVATPLTAGQAVTAGMYLGPDSLVEVNAAFAHASSERSSRYGEKETSDDFKTYRDGRASLFSARYKRFAGNSFYWHAGAGLRTTTASMLVAPRLLPEEKTKVASVDASDFGGVGGIGNAWHWQHFYLGCDWVGLYLPLVKFKSKYDDLGESLAGNSDLQNERRSFRDQSTGFNLQAIRFYLGASF